MESEESTIKEPVKMNGHAATGQASAHEHSPEGHTQPLTNREISPDSLKVLTEAVTAISTTNRSNVTRDILLKLPIFNGSPKEWPWFKAAYEESAPYFTEAENRCRLRASLRGAAKETAYCMLIGASTAAEAVELLRRRYGHPGTLIQMELDKLYAHPTVEENLHDICAFATQVSNVVALIRALDPRYLCSPWTEREILDKFPYDIRFRYFLGDKSDEPNLVKLDNYMRQLEDRLSILLGPNTEEEKWRNERAGRPSGGEQGAGDQPEESEDETDYKHTNPNIIAMKEMNKLYALPEIGDRKQEICDFQFKASIAILKIVSLKKEYLYCNPELVRAVVHKLPFRMRLDFCDYVAQKADEGDAMARLSRLNLGSLREFLLRMMHIAQMCSNDQEEDRQEAEPRQQWRRRRGRGRGRYPASRGRAY